MATGKKLRVLIAKPGLDGHDRGAKVVARALSNAGMEVLYSGLHQTPEQIVATALDEDVGAIGLSVLSGAHRSMFSRVVTLLREKGATDVLVFGGGTIPKKDLSMLEALGVGRIFGPGTETREIVAYLESRLPGARPGEEMEAADG
jgi:methylmalonyl-CoA mutase C-terminal domain/subunit